MKRVLVTGAANIGKAGVATIVYKWGQQFDSEKVVYDYLMQSGLPEEKYQDAIREKGGIIYTLNEKRSMFGIVKWVQEIIESNNYTVLHINSDSAYIAAAYIYAAKRAGIEHIYVHSHCTQIDDNNNIKRFIKTAIHKICKPYVIRNTDMFLACSKLAGEWMFGKKNVNTPKYNTIFNGVEVEKYRYDKKARDELRNVLGVSDKYVIGNVGRLSYQKNQRFLLKLFREYLKNTPNTVLIIVGEGELRDELEEYSNHLGIRGRVHFLGMRSDVPALISAFDCMVMPSLFEGLPVTMVEAQMGKLPCVVSDRITEEADFTGLVSYVSLEDELLSWVNAIHKYEEFDRPNFSYDYLNCDFNILNTAKELECLFDKE